MARGTKVKRAGGAWGSAVVLAVLGWSSPAAAEETRAEDHFLPEWMSIGIGASGQFGGNFLDEPGNQEVDGEVPTPDYPGFAGFTYGGGINFDVRFLGYVGFEMDVLFTQDRGLADLTITNLNTGARNEFTIEIGHSAVHVPLLLKGTIPGEIIQPNLVLGPEFVIPGDGEFEVTDGTNNSGATLSSFSDGSYTFFTFGLGMEVMLPIPSVDLRIPLQLRGSYNPGVSGERTERSNITTRRENNQLKVDTESYRTEWKFQANLNVGLMWHF